MHKAASFCLLSLCSLTALATLGCSKTMHVIVPESFHGQVTIQCVSTGRSDREIHTDKLGNAEAACPAIQPTIQVTRGNQPVSILGSPAWQQTKDGEMVAVHFTIE